MFDVYKPSGGFGLLAIPLLAVGVVITVVLAYVYHLALDWIPLIYLTFLITLGMGFAMGMIGGFIVNTGHVRNVMLAALIGLLMGTCGIGAKYWFQYRTLLDAATAQIIADENIPVAERAKVKKGLAQQVGFLKHLKFRADEGWQIGRGGGAPISGWFVYLIWLIEAGIIFFFAVTIPMGAATEPYSENKGKWADEAEVVMTLPVTDQEMVTKIQSATSVDELLDIPIPQTDQSNQFAVYTVNSIPGEEMEDAYLTVKLMTITVNNKGETETNESALVQHAVLPADNRKQLVENAELLQEAMADFRASVEEEAAAELASETPADEDQA